MKDKEANDKIMGHAKFEDERLKRAQQREQHWYYVEQTLMGGEVTHSLVKCSKARAEAFEDAGTKTRAIPVLGIDCQEILNRLSKGSH